MALLIITDSSDYQQNYIYRKCNKHCVDYIDIDNIVSEMKLRHFLEVYENLSLEQLEQLLPLVK